MKNSPVTYNEKLKIWHRVDYPHPEFLQQSIGEIFLRTMRSINQQKVLEYHYDTQEKRTARQIYTEAVTVALNLRRLGIRKGDVVVLYMLNNPKASSLALGCYLIGAVVNCFETQLSQEYIEQLFVEVQPSGIIYQTQFWRDIKEPLAKIKSLKVTLPLNSDATEQPNVHTDLLRPHGPLEEIDQFVACPTEDPYTETSSLVMTSGSTGIPKFARISHSLMLHGLKEWWPLPITEDSVLFSFSPLRWISQLAMILQSLLFGVKRVCVTGGPSGRYGAEVIRETKITHMFSAPGIYGDILSSVAADDCTSLASIRCLMLGGEPPAQAVMQMARKKSPHSKVYNVYGMTETAGLISHHEYINGGYLNTGVEMQILDAHSKPLGPATAGQIAIKTVAPFSGYLNRDRSVDFLANGFFVNGDYGLVDEDGKLHIMGRYKDLIKTPEVTIVPDTVESMIASLPEIIEGRLVPYHSSQSHNDIGALFVVPATPIDEDGDTLRVKIRELFHRNLKPTEAAILQDIHIVTTLPLTSCGKLDRAALKRYAASMKQRMRSIYAQLRKELEMLEY